MIVVYLMILLYMATITLTNVPEWIVSELGEQRDFSSVQFDGMDYCIDGKVIARKEDQVAWLEWQIDMIQWETVDAWVFLQWLLSHSHV